MNIKNPEIGYISGVTGNWIKPIDVKNEEYYLKITEEEYQKQLKEREKKVLSRQK